MKEPGQIVFEAWFVEHGGSPNAGPLAWLDLSAEDRAAWAIVREAGRAEGMREAARMARRHIEFYYPDVPLGGEACEHAILSAIGGQK